MKLTKSAVDGITPGDRDLFVWDTELPGFGIRCKPSGRKTYVIRYRNVHGRSRMYQLCRCCDLPPAQARDRARQVFADIARGSDPASDKLTYRKAPKLSELYTRYINEHALPYKKPKSVKNDRCLWKLHIEPVLGNLSVNEVTHDDVCKLHVSMQDKPYTANRVTDLLSSMFRLAEKWKLREPNTNPAKGVKDYKEHIRETILSVEQIQQILAELEHPTFPDSFRLLIKLLILTGCRLDEIRTAKVSYIDYSTGILSLPDSKTGERKIKLSTAALRLLQPVKNQIFICQGRHRNEYIRQPWYQWSKIRTRIGTNARMHDLRHTIGTLGHHSGLSQKQIGELLGHKRMSTTARYIHGTGAVSEHIAELFKVG